MVNSLSLKPWYLWTPEDVPRNLNITKEAPVTAILNYTDTRYNGAVSAGSSAALMLLSGLAALLLALLL
jgi:hypothetical protein